MRLLSSNKFYTSLPLKAKRLNYTTNAFKQFRPSRLIVPIRDVCRASVWVERYIKKMSNDSEPIESFVSLLLFAWKRFGR